MKKINGYKIEGPDELAEKEFCIVSAGPADVKPHITMPVKVGALRPVGKRLVAELDFDGIIVTLSFPNG